LNKLGEHALFIVERNFDTQIVVYQAELSPDGDLKGVRSYWTYANNLSDQSPMGEVAKNLFYGVTLKKVNRGLYQMRLACIPDQQDEDMLINLHIKKTKRVVPKVTIDGRECTLLKIYTDLTRIPPSLNGLWVTGRFKDEPVSKQVNVDRNVIDQFDFSSFM
jgi:hypothetical protein